jgi:hypothetical protein
MLYKGIDDAPGITTPSFNSKPKMVIKSSKQRNQVMELYVHQPPMQERMSGVHVIIAFIPANQ